MRVARALISVSDKSGVVEFAHALHSAAIEIVSTGGTAKLLREAGIPVVEITHYTGFPEILGGRVKTLHPKVHGGILARRDHAEDQATLERHAIPPIDLVAVNLYPFRETVARPDCTLEEAVANIDIGGPALLRAAAKNYPHVAVVTDPEDYQRVLRELSDNHGQVTAPTRFELACKAYSHTAEYDGAISNYLTAMGAEEKPERFPRQLNLRFSLAQTLRYGENPHQHAAFYRDPVTVPGSLSQYSQVQGKELSYNNIADADAAWECVKLFQGAACVIVKHANPCGVAVAAGLKEAYEAAFATDPTSAFGGIVPLLGSLDRARVYQRGAAGSVC
jgi:phosphoribosylaminoimidazolecarboxamide formyltransferase/IMP cyclohydrolase